MTPPGICASVFRMKRLPRKLSALLRAAVTDAQTLEKDPRYRLNMGVFHSPEGPNKTCHVCLAGAVMAQRLECTPDQFVAPDFPAVRPWEKRLKALDDMRRGHFESAASRIGLVPTKRQLRALEEAGYVVDYATYLGAPVDNTPGRAPWANYVAAADVLARAGL